jgi:hypothetical protein
MLAFGSAAYFLYLTSWFHHHLDAIIRIPFVFGSLLAGLFFIGCGIRVWFIGRE